MSSQLTSIHGRDRKCIGFILWRGSARVEAFAAWTLAKREGCDQERRTKPLGFFTDETGAIGAILKWMAPPDPGIVPSGIRDRAIRALQRRPAPPASKYRPPAKKKWGATRR